MENQELQQLANIYNTLLNVSTYGENTIMMADCLMALKQFIVTQKEKIDNSQKEE